MANQNKTAYANSVCDDINVMRWYEVKQMTNLALMPLDKISDLLFSDNESNEVSN